MQNSQKIKQVKVFATNAVLGKNRRSLTSEKPSRKPALFDDKKNKKKGGQDYKLMTKKGKNTTGIPSSEIDSLARALLPTIQELFKQEETKKEFEEWQAERKSKQLHKQNKDN